MNAKRFFQLLTLSWLVIGLSGCAGKKTTQPPSLHLPPPATTLPTTKPAPPPDPTQNLPPATTVETPPEVTRKEVKRVALVLGGAGVASFATVGILKRFQEEGIKVDLIVTTGWPTLFALGYGFMKSVHDVEWFATRLQEKDFYSVGIFDRNKDFASHDELSTLISNAFKQRDLADSRVPVVISAANTELGEPETFDRGEWKAPLLKTMSVPGIYRPYPENGEAGWISSLSGLDVDEAFRRGAEVVVAVEMYDDYFKHVQSGRSTNSENLFRKLYLTQLRKDLAKQMKVASVTAKISLGSAPGDFAQKRKAIVAGYKEGVRLAREIRKK